MEASAIEVRLRTHEARLDSSHRSVTELRSTSTRHETEIKVTGTEVREIREDIGEMKRELADARKEQKSEMIWLRRAIWGATFTFAGSIIAFATLILQGSGG
jgi:predicted RNase H-like nuclease (RuvC/YqgF family)